MSEDSALETVIGLVVLAAVLTQTWILVQDATQGDAGRHLRRWWHIVARPQVVRAVEWIDARALVAQLYADEITPYLEEASS